MLSKSCFICRHRVDLGRRMMIVDFEPEEQSNTEHWECKRVNINKLPNIREIVAASFQGEAVKAEVIVKECDQFALRTSVEETTNTRSETDIFDQNDCDPTGITDNKLEVNEQPDKANYPLDDENFFRSSAAQFTEAVLTLMTGIAIYKVSTPQ